MATPLVREGRADQSCATDQRESDEIFPVSNGEFRSDRLAKAEAPKANPGPDRHPKQNPQDTVMQPRVCLAVVPHDAVVGNGIKIAPNEGTDGRAILLAFNRILGFLDISALHRHDVDRGTIEYGAQERRERIPDASPHPGDGSIELVADGVEIVSALVNEKISAEGRRSDGPMPRYGKSNDSLSHGGADRALDPEFRMRS